MTLTTPAASMLGKIAGYIEILAKDPRSTVFVSLAETYRQMGLLDEALDVANRGVQALPSFSPGYSILGRIQAQRGKVDAAVAAFERALLIDPENLLSLKGLARVRMQQGDRAQALKLVQRALALKPDDAVAQKMLEAIGASPGVSPVSAAKPSAVLAAPADPAPAAIGEKVAARMPADPISTPTIAEIYIRQGFLGRAMKVYRDLLQADPRNEEIRQKLLDLKERIESQKATLTTAPGPSTPAAPTAVSTPLDPPVSAVAHQALSEEEQRKASVAHQLLELNRWLDLISRRKADVQ